MIKLKLIPLIFLLMLFFGVSGQERAESKLWTLQECVDKALENNLNLQQSKLDVTSQEVTLKQSRADLWPTLNAGANYGYNWGRGIDPTTNQFISQRIGFTGFSANSSVNLFSGFQKRNTIQQNEINLKASEKDLEDARNNISLNVISLYLNVIFNKEILSNNQTQLASTTRQLERTRIMVDAGSVPYANLLNLQSQLATNESNVVSAENNLNLSLLNLKQALLIPTNEPFDIEVPDLEVDANDLAGLNPEQVFEDAEATQPDIQSADLTVESAMMGEKIARGGAYPSVDLSGSIGSNYSDAVDGPRDLTSGTELQTVQIGFVEGTNQPVFGTVRQPVVIGSDNNYSITEQFSDNINQQLALRLSIPIFNGLSISSNVQRSKIQRQRAELNARLVRQNLRQIIEQAFNDAEAASKNYEASLKQVESLEESFRIANEQYQLGALNFVDYQIAENNLFQARTDLVRNKFDFIFKTKILDFYQGKPLTF